MDDKENAPINPVATGGDVNELGIVGGRVAGPGLARFVVGVYDNDSKVLCTGTLIAKDLVLTAAHCIRSVQNNIQVLFGINLSDGSAISINAAAIRIHPAFQRNRLSERNDIALIKLADEPPLYFSPINLPAKMTNLQGSEMVYMAGYGKTNFYKEDSKLLRMTFRKGATSNFSEMEFVVDMSDGRGTCKGDSGGPLIIEKGGEFFIMGIDSIDTSGLVPVNGQALQAPCTGGALFANVVYYLDWIQQEMQAL